MRELDIDVDPKELSFAELVRAIAEAAAHAIHWSHQAFFNVEAKHQHSRWLKRQGVLERSMTERFGR